MRLREFKVGQVRQPPAARGAVPQQSILLLAVAPEPDPPQVRHPANQDRVGSSAGREDLVGPRTSRNVGQTQLLPERGGLAGHGSESAG